MLLIISQWHLHDSNLSVSHDIMWSSMLYMSIDCCKPWESSVAVEYFQLAQIQCPIQKTQFWPLWHCYENCPPPFFLPEHVKFYIPMLLVNSIQGSWYQLFYILHFMQSGINPETFMFTEKPLPMNSEVDVRKVIFQKLFESNSVIVIVV